MRLDFGEMIRCPGTSTAFPSPLLLASTFDPDQVAVWADAIAEEFKAKGANVVLGKDDLFSDKIIQLTIPLFSMLSVLRARSQLFLRAGGQLIGWFS